MIIRELFLSVYKNKVLNSIINDQIRIIHNKLDKDARKLNWKELTETPNVLSQYGYFNEFKLFVNLDDNISKESGWLAAKYGHLHILKYIIDNHKPSSYAMVKIFKNAFIGGNLSVIEYVYTLEEWDFEHYFNFFVAIAEHGTIDLCEWFINHFKEMKELCEPNSFYYYATLSGNLNNLKWGIQFFNYVIEDDRIQDIWNNAIRSQNISLLEFMYSHERFKSSFDIRLNFASAIQSSNSNVIDWVFSKDKDCRLLDYKEVFVAIIERCSMEIIDLCLYKLGFNQEIHKNKAEWLFNKCLNHGFNVIDLAISKFKYEIIIWMYEYTNFQGTINPLQECEYSLELLKWFTENNRPEIIPSETMKKLGSYERQLPVVEYIIRNRSETFPNLQKILDFILLNSESMELLDMLSVKNRVTFQYTTVQHAISMNRLEAIKWIHKNTKVKYGIVSAYFLKDSAMVEWFHQNKIVSCDVEYVKRNFSRCSTAVQSFVINNQPDMIPSNVLEQLNDFSLSKFIIDHYPTKYIHNDSLFAVSKSGNVEIVKYLHEYYKKHDINHETNHFDMNSFYLSLDLSINYQYFDVIKYLCENGPKIKISNVNNFNDPMMVACKYGRLEICKYLQEYTPYKFDSSNINQVSLYGYHDILQWMKDISISN